MAEKYADKGYHTKIELLRNKDYNLDLLECLSRDKFLIDTSERGQKDER